MSITALDLIGSALRLINVQASGESVPLDMANDGLTVLNQMIDSWNIERLSIFTTRIDDFVLTLNKQSYTLGTGGDFNMPRPAQIDAMSAILTQNPANPIEVPMDMYSVDQWQTMVPVKNVPGNFPQICYDDGGYPLRTLSMWPIPAYQQNSVRIYSWQALTQPATLATSIALPPGYEMALRFNLAVLLAPEYGKEASPSVINTAISSKARLKTINAPDLTLRSDLLGPADNPNYRATEFSIPY